MEKSTLIKTTKSWCTGVSEALLHYIFPHVCAGCGTDLLSKERMICLYCQEALPQTVFHLHRYNPIEKLFWGRVPIVNATAQYYFTKESLMQRLMHQFKYKSNKELGFYLGRLMGYQLAETNRFSAIDALVPLPLFPTKEKRRGYNQATVLCEGIAEVLQKPVWKHVIKRISYTDSQTRKNRLERWKNMEGRFQLINEKAITSKHILLVDDVVTTGATLEACGQELLKAENVSLSVATLCFSTY